MRNLSDVKALLKKTVLFLDELDPDDLGNRVANETENLIEELNELIVEFEDDDREDGDEDGE